ncbi:MAG: Rieske 2Fe-2S domain-containing protein [Armatimonadota bacterium]|nr:Rieske 2Fe-2S domain-containing protein [Armatimonadota bacterium]MDR7452357.1 Rieske 2Fe-2S domain-containing protein [Armatimonadota bacterium]MDR7466917.1 Rieske 2Fe-2S domain-containing protein [Armatimonadota bacterium]MDR7493541.1 Rieske 2Fe-2S domain-containing protein [Armatimonadota bacterium]MDR7498806.1 Rieske 2Fe-2S domain-containing protein [Armatimonadota bacterium]
MNEASSTRVRRRGFLKLVTAVPVAGALAALASPLLRLLKPNVPKFDLLRPTAPDTARGEAIVAASLSELRNPWDFKYFVFTQRYPQYTPQGFKTASVPGVAVRLPYKIRLPLDWAQAIGKEPPVRESDIIVFSRICPHLGCIYNYVPNYREVTAGYGGYVPPPQRQHALMACPCHLSIYDPADRDVPGRVLSGPAPRPPRTFLFEIRNAEIVVTDVEPGGIA